MIILESLYIRQCLDLLQGLLTLNENSPRKYCFKNYYFYYYFLKIVKFINKEYFCYYFLETFAESHLEKFFLFSLMWSLGSVLELDGRAAFQEFVLSHPSKCNWPKCKVIYF